MGLLDEVRAGAATVAANAQLVRIRTDQVMQYAASLPIEQAQSPELDPQTHYLGEPDATLAYVLTLDALNFGSGFFPHLKKRPGMSGYFTVASSLKDLWLTQRPLTAEQMQRITAADCVRIFGQDSENAVAGELMALFARALNDLGVFLGERYVGEPVKLVDAAEGSAERLVELLTAMPFYRDVGFYKRAQLTAADLSTAGVAAFDDLDRLTIFADNLVPHVLRLDGLLEYDTDLLASIDREELVAAGSRAELEIRAGALHAVELIVDAARRQGRPATAMQLDYVLWNRGQQPSYKAQPRHRTRTVFY
ncbi:MAG TPA: queuosine salvage family protein [Chloroflexota bacterium]|nr:queuosine salvage family protein [Chloroflexota bacterium]